jgi:hypothetical protein
VRVTDGGTRKEAESTADARGLVTSPNLVFTRNSFGVPRPRSIVGDRAKREFLQLRSQENPNGEISGNAERENQNRPTDNRANTSCVTSVCYNARMVTQTKSKRRTTMVPVTTMEEIPVLDDKERAELVRSLDQAQREVKAGKATKYEPKRLKDRLLRIHRGNKQ